MTSECRDEEAEVQHSRKGLGPNHIELLTTEDLGVSQRLLLISQTLEGQIENFSP